MIRNNVKILLLKILLFILYALFCLFFLIFIYQFFAVLLGIIPVNQGFKSTEKGIEIFVGTNGVHTDLVFPVANELINWRDLIPLEDFPAVDTSFRYVAIGWGDKGFYIQTPTWQDLTFNTAVKALFLASPAAMHITFLRIAPINKNNYVSLRISDQNYIELINFIIPYFQTNEQGEILLIPEANYSLYDNFYEANGHYHLLNTSNNWTNSALKTAGIRAAIWAPFDQTIMHQLRKAQIE